MFICLPVRLLYVSSCVFGDGKSLYVFNKIDKEPLRSKYKYVKSEYIVLNKIQ